MSKTCITEGCNRKLSGYALRNKLYDAHCSLFCKLSSERGDRKCHPKETITRTCYVCHGSFNLKYPFNHANQRCCNKECNLVVERLKHGRRNYAILTILYELAPAESNGFTAQDVYDRIASKYPFNIKGHKGITQILKPFVKRGIVEVTIENKGIRVYRWSSALLPGSALQRHKTKVLA